MNPINLIMNYLIADSRIKHYNVSEKEKVQTTALVIGAFSQNPLIDYMIIDNQAKNLQQNTTSEVVTTIPASTSDQNSTPIITNPKSEAVNQNDSTKSDEIKKIEEIANKAYENFKDDFITIIKSEIPEIVSNELLKLSPNVKNEPQQEKIEEILKEFKHELEGTISEKLSKIISEKFLNHLIKSENPEMNKLSVEFDKEISHLRVMGEKSNLDKVKKDIEELIKNKNIKLLEKKEQEIITQLKKLIAKNGYFDRIENIIANQKDSSVLDFNIIYSSATISNLISDIRRKIYTIESENLAGNSKE